MSEPTPANAETYRIVPLERGLEVIRLWAESPWPMTPAQALHLRDHLGWTSSPTKESMFTTNHDLQPKDASFTTINQGTTVAAFEMRLSSFAPQDLTPILQPKAEAAFDAYAQVLSDRYGKPKRDHARGVTSLTWALPNGATVFLATKNSYLGVTIESPAYNAAAAGEAQYFEQFGPDADSTA